MIKDKTLILEPWPNGGWTITTKNNPPMMCDHVGAYSTVDDMLAALNKLLTESMNNDIDNVVQRR